MKLTFERLEDRRMLAVDLILLGTETVLLDGTVMTATEFTFPGAAGPVNVTVSPVPDYTVLEDEELVVSDADGVSGGQPGVQWVAGPTNADLVLGENGEFIFVPRPDRFGEDYFLWSRDSQTYLTTVMVVGVNDPPDAVDDLVDAVEDIEWTFDVLANDFDRDGDELDILSHTQPSDGMVVHDGNGIFTYTPPADFYGTTNFTYVVTDREGGTDSAVVAIDVSAVNDPPVAVDDAYSTQVGEALGVQTAIGLLVNDSDVDGDPIAGATVTSEPGHGVVTVTDTGAFLYRPNPGYVGGDSFEYKAFDGLLWSEPATVTINVVASSDPIARSEVYVSGPDGITVDAAMGVLANDSPTGLTASIVTDPVHGIMVLAADGSLTYTPAPGYVGADPFGYRATTADGLFVDEIQSAIWVEAAPVADLPSPETGKVKEVTTPVGGGSIYDMLSFSGRKKDNWDPIAPPYVVDLYYYSEAQ